jgi:hypothetical protein
MCQRSIIKQKILVHNWALNPDRKITTDHHRFYKASKLPGQKNPHTCTPAQKVWVGWPMEQNILQQTKETSNTHQQKKGSKHNPTFNLERHIETNHQKLYDINQCRKHQS